MEMDNYNYSVDFPIAFVAVVVLAPILVVGAQLLFVVVLLPFVVVLILFVVFPTLFVVDRYNHLIVVSHNLYI